MAGITKSVRQQFNLKHALKFTKHGALAHLNPVRGHKSLLNDIEGDVAVAMDKANVEAPVLMPEKVMPTIDDDAIQAAKRRKSASIQAQSGRNSTVLSDRLGG